MRAFIVPDAHGDLRAVSRLLRAAGIIDDRLTRIDRETLVVQIGDLCNCVAASIDDDRGCLKQASAWFDVYLAGNHEHPYLGGPRFSGFWHDPEIRTVLRRYFSRSLLLPCVAIDGVLVSHAGLTIDWKWRKAESAERDLCELWRTEPAAAVFSQIGRSRSGGYKAPAGTPELGGLLWSDWSEPKLPRFNQLVGHTHAPDIRRIDHPNGNWAACVDVGTRHGDYRELVGAWLEDGFLAFQSSGSPALQAVGT